MRKSINDDENLLLVAMLKEARVTAGFSQQGLAETLDHYRTFVSKYEARERRLDIAEIRKICSALDLRFIEFMADYDLECGLLPKSLIRDVDLRNRL
jgi:ribosome-binding protein aMBF1 (putative translation factor)